MKEDFKALKQDLNEFRSKIFAYYEEIFEVVPSGMDAMFFGMYLLSTEVNKLNAILDSSKEGPQ